jgi:catechol 2,3-dioxygenase
MSSSLQLQSVALRVPDLARSLAFYTGRLGFNVRGQSAGRAELAADPDGPGLLALLEERAAPAHPPDAAGLFHAALLLPDRPALGAWLNRAADAGVEFDGFADHGVSDALYLTDPDGNGLEFYADRPRAAWPREPGGELAMFTHALDPRKLVAEGTGVTGSPLRGARWGHLHLRVSELERSESYYHGALGLETMQRSFPGARFLAADGYHHHLGLNTWGQPSRPRPPGALGLASATFARRGAQAADLNDPDAISVRIEPAAE